MGRPVNLLLFVVAAAAVLLLVMWAGQRWLMYFPMGSVPSPSALGLTDVEAVTFETADGLRLNGWFVPAGTRDSGPGTRSEKSFEPRGPDPGSRSPDPARGTVLVFNGNAGNRAYRAPLAEALRSRGFQVLLFDYRGFGGNPGSPTEHGLELDARAARDYLTARADVDATRLAYFGESLGTAVAVGLALDHPPAALILRSPFTSMTEVGHYHYPWLPVRRFLRDRYPTLERIGRVRVPLLVIAGDLDGIVPPEQSRRVFEAAPGPKAFQSFRADHNDYELLGGEMMIDAITRFLEASLPSRIPSPGSPDSDPLP